MANYQKTDLEERLKTILHQPNCIVARILPAVADACQKSEIEDWWLAGGAIRNTVWRSLYGEDCRLVINDFDIAFFDQEGDREQELGIKSTLEYQYPQYKFDVKNQASFAVWRPGRRPYKSVADGIGDWLHTATSVGVRLEKDGSYSISSFAANGLEDLFDGIIRPTPEHLDCPIARAKAETFLAACPRLVKA